MEKLVRYHHNCHKHKLFQNIIRHPEFFCDNINCGRRMHCKEVVYTCFKCNFDLCAYCFLLPSEPDCIVPLCEEDKNVNEDIYFIADRYKNSVKTVKTNNLKDNTKEININNDDEYYDEYFENKEEEEEEEEEVLTQNDLNEADEFTRSEINEILQNAPIVNNIRGRGRGRGRRGRE